MQSDIKKLQAEEKFNIKNEKLLNQPIENFNNELSFDFPNLDL